MAGLRIHGQYPQQRSKTHIKKGCPCMTQNGTWWRAFSSRLLGVWSTRSLSLLPDSHWLGVRVQSMGQINLFKDYLYWMRIRETIQIICIK